MNLCTSQQCSTPGYFGNGQMKLCRHATQCKWEDSQKDSSENKWGLKAAANFISAKPG